MENIIIIGIIAVVVAAAILHTVKHFRGKGGCCGGGSSYKPRKKKFPSTLYQKTFKVEGMHCDHCKNRVEEAVNDIPGVAGSVDLKKGQVTVSYAQDVSDEVIRAKIQRAGYTVAE